MNIVTKAKTVHYDDPVLGPTVELALSFTEFRTYAQVTKTVVVELRRDLWEQLVSAAPGVLVEDGAPPTPAPFGWSRTRSAFGARSHYFTWSNASLCRRIPRAIAGEIQDGPIPPDACEQCRARVAEINAIEPRVAPRVAVSHPAAEIQEGRS